MQVRASALLFLLVLWGPALAAPKSADPKPAVQGDCSAEAATLTRDEAELPSLKFVTRADKPPYCITLETVMEFAARLKAHVAHCVDSIFAASASEWEKTRIDYTSLFVRARCRRTIFN